MTYEEKRAVLVGAAAGATPVLVNLIDIDAALIIDSFQMKIAIGYLIKTIGLMILGGFFVFINQEIDIKKAFQLGIMAPAVVIGMLNANNLSEANDQIEVLDEQLNIKSKVIGIRPEGISYLPIEGDYPPSKPLFSLISLAYANDLIGEHGEPSTTKLIWYGVTGNISNGWFVIVGSHKTENSAKKQADNLKLKGYDARVYPPFGGNEYYGVMIGAYVSLETAKDLKASAIKDGLPSDTYLWKWRP